MSKFRSPLAIAGAILVLPCLGAAPARALSKVTFVSGKGTDAGTCASPATPCRLFQFAIGQTDPGGEIKALDPAAYGFMVITKSISITGVEGASINSVAGDHITINAGDFGAVNLSHLTLDGANTAINGIVLNSGRSLTITHCTMRKFRGDGIALQPTVTFKFLIGDTLVSGSGAGITVAPTGTGSAQGILDHVSATGSNRGIFVSGSGTADVTAVDSRATNNLTVFDVNSGVLRLARSVAEGNVLGVNIIAAGTGESFGDNDIRGNVTDVAGALTLVAKQ